MAVFKKIAIFGVGLIGGSFALALKKSGAVSEVIGVGRRHETLVRAASLGIIDSHTDDVAQAVAGADLVLIAAPVAQTASLLQVMAPYLEPDTVVTDAGSTKTDVIMAAKTALGDKVAQFIPAHPIAGGAQHGASAAKADLYLGKEVIICPLQENAPAAVEAINEFWLGTGANTHRMSSLQHDAVFAAISHLPHVLSFALMLQVANAEDANVKLGHAGAGFRDFTRIAASSPEMWRDISLANKTALLKEMDQYLNLTKQLRDMIAKEDGDALLKAFTRASAERQKWEGR
jgi:prephenate dehydrogenase